MQPSCSGLNRVGRPFSAATTSSPPECSTNAWIRPWASKNLSRQPTPLDRPITAWSAYSGPLCGGMTCIITPCVKRTQTPPPKTSKWPYPDPTSWGSLTYTERFTILLLYTSVDGRSGISEDAVIRLTFTSESIRFHRLWNQPIDIRSLPNLKTELRRLGQARFWQVRWNG